MKAFSPQGPAVGWLLGAECRDTSCSGPGLAQAQHQAPCSSHRKMALNAAAVVAGQFPRSSSAGNSCTT